MNGKLEFGCDYLNIMRNLELAETPKRELDPIEDAAARLFLLNWGLSITEIDDANQLFWDRAQNNSLEVDLNKVIDRIYNHIVGDRGAVERFVIELAAIGFMDANVTNDEDAYVLYFKDKFDFKQSEFMALCSKGTDLSIALNYFGDAYMKAHIDLKN